MHPVRVAPRSAADASHRSSRQRKLLRTPSRQRGHIDSHKVEDFVRREVGWSVSAGLDAVGGRLQFFRGQHKSPHVAGMVPADRGRGRSRDVGVSNGERVRVG